MRKVVTRLASVPFVHKAIEEDADLSAFHDRPSRRVVLGISAILLSYVICWPVIALLSATAIIYGQPSIIVIGGPLDYALSHLVFLFGMYLAGARYSLIFLRWLAKAVMLRMLRRYSDADLLSVVPPLRRSILDS